uniref:Zn-ribbon domain-containing OB-fold protein n=1 Tax=Desulfomonile tiedjei TaxID=2358 RepID=A0A7C4AQF2_9BACT
MEDWRDHTEALTLKGQISLPYRWWVGKTGSRFLTTLREKKTILGNKCPQCATVYIPPRKNCGRCFTPITEMIQLSDEGVVTSFTIVRFQFELHPTSPPFAYALIKLDGADVSFLHIIKDDLTSLRNFARVKAVFAQNRVGSIWDIECFRLI